MRTATVNILTDTFRKLLVQGRDTARELNRFILVSLSQRVPFDIEPLPLFAAAKVPGNRRVFWCRPEKNFWLVGSGLAAEFKAEGSGYIEAAGRAYREMINNAVIQAPANAGAGPLGLGGFRFDIAARKGGVWKDYPDAALVLPRFLFTFSGNQKWLTINTMVNRETDCAALEKSFSIELMALSQKPLIDRCQPQGQVTCQTGREEWRQRVKVALQDIQQGTLTKVVLSRTKTFAAASPLSLEYALDRLIQLYPECIVFAFDNCSTSFAGATPESLAHVENGRLDLNCLASSIARGASLEEDQRLELELLSSPKELREHTAVLTMLSETLKGTCLDICYSLQPRIWKLRNVQHLLTPVSAELKRGKGLLDVVKALHPTPAVGGTPTAAALDLIRRFEGDRGWYAAPVGWIDHRGNGEFAVAIRSALLDCQKAYLYAGAGIVEGSLADQEFEETEIKFQPMLAALGIEGRSCR